MERIINKETEELPPEPILKEGLVWKRGRKVTSTWKRRYFILRESTLSYHIGVDSEDNERRFIEITQNSTVTHRTDKHPFAFQVRTPGFRKITAKCDAEEEFQSWFIAIEDCIRRAPSWPIKCVVVGDDEEATFGKRVMVNRYLDACRSKEGEAKLVNPHGYTQVNKSRTRIVKTPDEFGNVDIMFEYEKDEWVKLMLWHLDGREQCTKLRLLAYPHSDMFVVVFSVSDAKSFEKVDFYMKEIRNTIKTTSSSQNALFLIVGTRISSNLVQVGFNQAEEKARALGASGYVECRIDTEEECEEVFSDAVRLVVEKAVTIFSTNGEPSNHGRQASGFLSSIGKILKRRIGDENKSSSQTQTDSVHTNEESPDNSPKYRRGFFRSSEKFASQASPNRSKSNEELHKNMSSNSIVKSSVNDEDDTDEGSLIGVEVDEQDEDLKARMERDFGFQDMKDDVQYTAKVFNRANSGRRDFHKTASNTTNSTQDLYDIEETTGDDREQELEELRVRDARREREINHMKSIMDSLRMYNKIVEDQLRAMREELANVNQHGGALVGVLPPMPPLSTPPVMAPIAAVPTASSLTLPPLPPLNTESTTSSRYIFNPKAPSSKTRGNRATSVFF